MMNSEDRDCAAVTPEQVVMLCQGDEVYGVGSVLKLYALALPEISYVALGEGPMVDWLKEQGRRVDVIHGFLRLKERGPSLLTLLRMPQAITSARRDAEKIDRFLRPRGIRVVQAHWRAQQITAGFLRRRGYKSIWHIHYSMTRSRLLGMGVKMNHQLASWGADLLLPVSDYIGRNWRGSGVPMTTILNAAVPMFDQPNVLPERPIRCVIAGRMEHEKGHHVAVEAVIRARQAGFDVQLDLFGSPLENNEYLNRLRQRIDEVGCVNAFRFLGFRTDLRSMHQQYHLGLQCRVNPEPCGVWICETLVDGLPLIASATGGTPELVEDGETGLLCRPGDAEDLSDKLIQLGEDSARLNRMRWKVFERGQRLFTMDRFARNTLDAYQLLTKTPGGTAGGSAA